MSAREIARHQWQNVQAFDENTPLRTKISVLIAIATFMFVVGGWVRGTDAQGADNTKAIAGVATKVDALDAKVSTIADNLREFRYEVRSNLRPVQLSTATASD